MKNPCPYCGNLIPDSGVFGLDTYEDIPENHKENCPIREIMEVSILNNSSECWEKLDRCNDCPVDFPTKCCTEFKQGY